MNYSLQEIAQKLSEKNSVLLLTHKNPDGDTLGSGTALCRALSQMGKQVVMRCSDAISPKFEYLLEEFPKQPENFSPDCIVSVDIADPQLLGESLFCYADQIDICIDHHKLNRMTAQMSYIDVTAAATCEIIYELLLELNSSISPIIADCLYTGLCTDTGCFKFANVTAKTHRIAADLIDFGCHYARINRELFDVKSRARIQVERQVLEQIEFYAENRIAFIVISQKMILESGIDPADLDGVSGIPRQIQGVEIGVTMKERPEGGYRVSLRTAAQVDASQICARFGGGGHARAAGCVIDDNLENSRKKLLAELTLALCEPME